MIFLYILAGNMLIGNALFYWASKTATDEESRKKLQDADAIVGKPIRLLVQLVICTFIWPIFLLWNGK